MEDSVRHTATLRLPAVGGILLGGMLLLSCAGPRSGSQKTESPPARVYRVQLQMTEEKKAAIRTRARAEQWWNNQPAAERPSLVKGVPSSSAAVTIDWKPPFYRVRLGPFATRNEAEAVLGALRSTFPDAFIAPKRINNR